MIFNNNIQIGKWNITSSESPVFIIAEAGVNHGGDIALAKKMIDEAAKAGVNAVKFQAFRTENLILRNVEKASYQKVTTESTESQFEMLKKLELTKESYKELQNYCNQKGLIFLITPFDEISLQELEDIGVQAYKIASTDTTNLPFLKKTAQTGKPIILSTGMCFLKEVEAALKEIYPINKDVILLQCTANYPVADDEANLNVLNTYKESFNIIIGYSDHTIGLGAAPFAVAMGAKVIEKHFTLDKSSEGPDQSASLNIEELSAFVRQVRRIETYLGSPEKKPTNDELNTRKSLQKCLVASMDIALGELFTEHNVVAKRTGGIGISPLRYKDVIGKRAKQNFKINDIIYV